MKIKGRNQIIKEAFIFAACLLPIGAIGGYFTGKYAIASYSPEVQQTILDQIGSIQMLAVIAMIQSALYAFVFGVIGYLVSVKIGLMKSLYFKKQELLPTIGITIGCGVIMALDYWTFGAAIPKVRALYADGILYKSIDNWLASIFYGGVIEEVMLRLCVMSVLALIIWKIFFRSEKEAPASAIIAANVLSALVFAAGHLPTAMSMFGTLTPLLLFRIVFLNGILGMVYGWLYQKKGIQYAMTAHAGTHIISKLIWLIFL
ncbi:MAG: CPBP family intramembrane metalloprotease [Lachnospiraceae bacterium]|nr:CPBP family intramembrane metalloprotease [Lachnospiraceae bacterium]